MAMQTCIAIFVAVDYSAKKADNPSSYMYSMTMKRVILPLFLVLSQTGCAVYTGASAVSFITTDKTLTDHATTLVTPNGDCSSLNIVQGKYYCEIRDVSVTYNRSAY